MQINSQELPKQGFMCHTIHEIDKIQNIKYRTDKPKGGLWTSPFCESGLTEWQEWCKYEMPNWFVDNVIVINPNHNAKIFRVDCLDDLQWLWDKYGIGNWEGVSQEWDAVWCTKKAVWNLRYHKPFDLYGWDIESVLWFRI